MSFSLAISALKRDTAAKRLAAAKSNDPERHRLLVIGSDVLASGRLPYPNDEHRLTARELGLSTVSERETA